MDGLSKIHSDIMVYKTIFQLILYLGILIFGFWVFNNINPWLGILINILLSAYLLNKLVKQLKTPLK